ncbi:lysogenization regulator HflD [Thalassotalea euphylliae]|uniref:High frequency lysogenization protein HflD homolog n=1 Tax=Thalassotalea euphylliae TaxID=1655234 RepID=A0A3E0TQT2_9GAMM|nr:high frequency lysogenization protein HflD [Thalassotalea euphylliae]REL26813.1 lysogenization regulator HflD [Thalassotalea euphylliae]REL35491.1 lysogenization regulator HflD [Thalassotalea euphylliae]
MRDQTITFAAICQIASMVQKLARQGEIDEQQLGMMLSGITNTSPENTLAVYGGNLANIKPGLQVLVSHLGDQTKQKDPELTRYIVSLLNLERRLTKNRKQLGVLGERIDQAKRQSGHYDVDSNTLLNSFASIYSDIISPLGARIQVAGEPAILKQESNQHKIRALLLAGIRSAVLWRQVGGKRRNILFSRTKILAQAEQLLGEIY